ncbi:MAG TPA: aldolase/citrate lyase family protein [Pseudolabrys sp.]|jgi:2-keto-3-deoxy-L-rhamnonate aldolase RhmA|nr:aldolase/citrate lyase family protein [Pseudolabrys sp.]
MLSTDTPVANRVKQKLARGEIALCMATRSSRTADIGMIAAACGFDSFFVDMEHCPISTDDAAQICAAALPLGITPMVRIPGHEFTIATRLLDGGALGIICPHVDTLEQAAAFVNACKFPPLGHRSVSGAGPTQLYRPAPLKEVNRHGNDVTLLIAMLETPEAIANADAIASVQGLDMLLIGSNDLCTELGIAGELHHPKLRAAFETAAAACKAHKIHLGIGGVRGDIPLIKELVQGGGRFIIAGSDTGYLMSAALADATALRAAIAT